MNVAHRAYLVNIATWRWQRTVQGCHAGNSCTEAVLCRDSETLNFLLESLPSEACLCFRKPSCWVFLGAHCGEPQADLSPSALPAVPQAAAASVGKSPSPERLKPELSPSPCYATIPSSGALQGNTVLAPQALPGHSHSPGARGLSFITD